MSSPCLHARTMLTLTHTLTDTLTNTCSHAHRDILY